MANLPDFGEITEIIQNKWGTFFSTKLDDGREQRRIPFNMMSLTDSGNHSDRFVLLEAYEARRKAQIERFCNK